MPPPSTWKRAAQALLLTSLLGLSASCESDQVKERPLTVQLFTDLTPVEEVSFVRVQLLDVNETPREDGWLELTGSCPSSGEGQHLLGTFEVNQGSLQRVRLLVSAFTKNEAGEAVPLLSARANVTLADGKNAVDVMLARVCTSEAVTCDEGLTCDPASGSCSAPWEAPKSVRVERQGCTKVTYTQTVATPPVGEDADLNDAASDDAGMSLTGDAQLTRCIDADGQCPSGCYRDTDSDCGGAKGVTCAGNSDCRQGLYCEQGYCCDRRCDGTCERCDVSGFIGECHPVDYSQASQVEHCGGCNDSCGQENAQTATCELGRCAYTCNGDFADCDAEKNLHNGCEQNIADDPKHCGGCGEANVCAYPFCFTKQCAVSRGKASAAGFEEFQGNAIVGTAIRLAPSTVVGLGALLNRVSGMPTDVRFALYESASDKPGKLLSVSQPVELVDYQKPATGAPKPFTMAAIEPVAVVEGVYWVLITANRPFQVRTESLGSAKRWVGDAVATFDSFPPGTDTPGLPILDLTIFNVDANTP